jgi:hypothetical protein
MLIETITAPDDYKTLYGLRAIIGLREIIVAKTMAAALPDRSSAAPQKTGETNKGTVRPDTGNNNKSIMLKAAEGFRGS